MGLAVRTLRGLRRFVVQGEGIPEIPGSPHSHHRYILRRLDPTVSQFGQSESRCRLLWQSSQRGCSFKLNNDNVAELTMALSQLESLLLGRPCSSDACATTAACLLSISVHCAELRELEIHFNATNIVDDLENISDDPDSKNYARVRGVSSCF